MNANILMTCSKYKYLKCKSQRILLNSAFFNLELYETVLMYTCCGILWISLLSIYASIFPDIYPPTSIGLYIYLTKANVRVTNQNGIY